ncbi:MerR family transcriptional regulator [Sediminihabitans luteus]|uniref:MerR family transcriptional regulator n=1 Tax=Sediminihabitans luteus TaxID=1138585 RepID=A0A2M9CEM0_9CELL|nr:helix-turn-helix domain-containing protein [Sediminihabitans luteus]PJJ70374.1 MerR family transcriptional regulator [Sediminihabitans luteus]GII97846.1 MerR family transcriptional regulator [Sediminihabitans luteus]
MTDGSRGEGATDGMMTRGEMAHASGLSPKALRLYDANGLLHPARVDPATGYRYYAPAQLDAARTIAALRRLDMPLARVREALACDPSARTELLLAWWDERRTALATGLVTVESLVTQLGDDAGPGTASGDLRVQERTVPERTVAAVAFRTTQAELVPRFTAAVLDVRTALARGGATFGTEFWVVYHGVLEAPDAYVEVCVPYTGAATPTGAVVLRAEPAGREAFVEIGAQRCAFPQILGAFGSVRAHARERGGTVGPAREIYPVPWSDDGHVADVAVPLGGTVLDPAPGARPSLGP